MKFFCPICNENAKRIFISKHKKSIYECKNKNCGHFFTPPHKENQGIVPRFENIETLSDKSLSEFGERNERLLNLFTNKLDKKDYPINFLDYGAGVAHVSRTFKQVLGAKANIYCLEANPACLNLYEKYGLTQILTLNELNKKIDFVFMIEVIEHIEDPIVAMRQIIPYLNTNGLLFLSTPMGSRIENKTNAYDTPSHLHFFSKKSLNLMLKKSGFSEISFKYYPEMYPISQSKYIKLKIAVKKLISKLLFNSKNSITHLVGFTKYENKFDKKPN